MKHWMKFVLLPSVVFAASVSEANLQVLPTRVVLSSKQRTAQVTLKHTGKSEMRYRIKPIFYRMQPDGAMVEVTPNENDRSAMTLFRYSPRQISLKPNVEQVVRVMMKTPADLPVGEYRAHLHFEAADDVAPGERGEGQGSRLMLQARLAVAIPVVVKNGDVAVKARLSNPMLKIMPDGKAVYAVELTKETSAFVYGDFFVSFKDEKGKVTELGAAKGVSSYIDKRIVSYPLEKKPSGKGTLVIELRSTEDEGGAVLASTSKRID